MTDLIDKFSLDGKITDIQQSNSWHTLIENCTVFEIEHKKQDEPIRFLPYHFSERQRDNLIHAQVQSTFVIAPYIDQGIGRLMSLEHIEVETLGVKYEFGCATPHSFEQKGYVPNLQELFGHTEVAVIEKSIEGAVVDIYRDFEIDANSNQNLYSALRIRDDKKNALKIRDNQLLTLPFLLSFEGVDILIKQPVRYQVEKVTLFKEGRVDKVGERITLDILDGKEKNWKYIFGQFYRKGLIN